MLFCLRWRDKQLGMSSRKALEVFLVFCGGGFVWLHWLSV